MKLPCIWLSMNCTQGDHLWHAEKIARGCPFNEERSCGFIIDTVDDEGLLCQFIQKDLLTETIRDPFGNVLESSRVTFSRVQFRVLRAQPVCEVLDPGKSLKKFVTILSNEGTLSLAPIKPNLNCLIDAFETQFSGLEVILAETKDFLVNSRTVCSIAFRSTVDVRADIQHFLKNRSIEFIRVRLKYLHKRVQHDVEISKSGRFIIDFDFFASENDPLRHLLLQKLQQNQMEI